CKDKGALCSRPTSDLDSSVHRRLERLSDAEEEVEVPGLSDMRRGRGVVVNDRVDRGIQVPAEVQADRPNRSLVPQPQSCSVLVVIEIACAGFIGCALRRKVVAGLLI